MTRARLGAALAAANLVAGLTLREYPGVDASIDRTTRWGLASRADTISARRRLSSKGPRPRSRNVDTAGSTLTPYRQEERIIRSSGAIRDGTESDRNGCAGAALRA